MPTKRIVAVDDYQPDLVLLDLHLAHGTTGFSVAARLNDLGVACLFVSGKAPRFPMPDLALGCLMKPFTAEDVHRSLAAAEDLLRGREAVRPKMPENLMLYEPKEEPSVARARVHSVEAVATHPARALDFGPPALKPHHSPPRLALAECSLGQPCARIDQRLPAPLDVGAALHVLEAEAGREAWVRERAARRMRRSCGQRSASMSKPA